MLLRACYGTPGTGLAHRRLRACGGTERVCGYQVEYPKLLHPYTYVKDAAGYTSVILDEDIKTSPQLEQVRGRINCKCPPAPYSL